MSGFNGEDIYGEFQLADRVRVQINRFYHKNYNWKVISSDRDAETITLKWEPLDEN